MNQLLGLGVSFGFVFGLVGFAAFLLMGRVISSSVARKIIHIGVGHWWFLAEYYFVDISYALIGPGVFILLNWAVGAFHLVPAMENKESNWGTVYYPISLLLLVIGVWGLGMPSWIGAMAVMILAWGDGLAAVVGKLIYPTSTTKTGAGFVSMAAISLGFLVVFTVGAGLFDWSLPFLTGLVGLALGAALVEYFTPWGLDNLTIPLFVSLGTWYFLV
ncbi:MAG: hypothetical protein GW949_02105 [Spirochaetales bacterium]|nr:hypothetical protein [Spirochaetales bacterium]